jgi:hypothetical protein
MKWLVFPLLTTAVSLPLAAVRAQDESENRPPPVIMIRPASSPVPALVHRLLPERRELVPGNAAIFYHRAIERLIEVRLRRSIKAHDEKKTPRQINEEEEKLQAELNKPLGALPKDVVRGYLDSHSFCLREVELGARREFCDWELQRRDEGYALILSELQEARGLARLVALKVRLELAEGRIDPAIHWLQTGMALARHVGQGNIFIQSLISAAILEQMAVPLEELIQAPGAPNLYWALANLPRPFLDLTDALEGERYILEKEFPSLKDLDSAPWTLEQARALADELKQKYADLTGDWARAASPTSRPEMKDLGEHLMFTTIVARAYPTAKHALIAQGRPASLVEAMPAIQAVALYSYQLYQEARDDIFKWCSLPYWQGYEGLKKADENPRAGWLELKSGIPFALVLPAIRSVHVVPVRVDRRLDVVQIIEAIRLYAAAHQGTLPPNLDALNASPAPLDPATGKSFDYKLNGETATLAAPPPPGWQVPQYRIHYELKLAR